MENTDFLFEIGVCLYRIQREIVMKKDNDANQELLQYLEQLQTQKRDGFIIPMRKNDCEYKRKLLNLLKVIGPIAEA